MYLLAEFELMRGTKPWYYNCYQHLNPKEWISSNQMQLFFLLFVWRKMLRMQNRFLGNMPIIGRLGFRGREGNTGVIKHTARDWCKLSILSIIMLILFQKSDNQGILRCNQKIIKMAKRNCAELLYIVFNYWLQTKSTINIKKETKRKKPS